MKNYCQIYDVCTSQFCSYRSALILNQQDRACCLQFEYHHLHTSIFLHKETNLPPGESKKVVKLQKCGE